jgi:hypothetical protein
VSDLQDVICRECGATGYTEVARDPCPGLCPSCFAAALRRSFDEIPIPPTTDPAEKAIIREKLRAIGVTSFFIDMFVELAEDTKEGSRDAGDQAGSGR